MIATQKLIRFGIVGVLTALLQWTLLFLGVEILGADSTLVSTIAFVIVVTFNYLMHYSWTFTESGPHTETLSRYLFMIFCGLCINGLIMYYGVNYCQINYMLVQALAFVAVISWNLTVALLWVFRGS